MKSALKWVRLLFLASLLCAWCLPSRASFTVIHSFPGTGGDGSFIQAVAVGPDGMVYGAARAGGTNNAGTVFKVRPDGTGFQVLHHFVARSQVFPYGNAEGASIQSVAVGTDGYVYGAAKSAGTNGQGTIFRVKSDGMGFQVLHTFSALADTSPGTNSDGAAPVSVAVGPDGNVYGVAQYGGTGGSGTVFVVGPIGFGFGVLHAFSAEAATPPYGNADGINPTSVAVGSNGNVYVGTTNGGTNRTGTLFQVKLDGQFQVLHTFSAQSNTPPYGNADGAYVTSVAVDGNGFVYGVTGAGGASATGTIFKINPATFVPANPNASFQGLYAFGTVPNTTPRTNVNGAFPRSVAVDSAGNVYGVARIGGASGEGTAFKVKSDGTGFQVLHAFSATSSGFPKSNADGASPQSIAVGPGDGVYGAAESGGVGGIGTVFNLVPAALTVVTLTLPNTATIAIQTPPSVLRLGSTDLATPGLDPRQRHALRVNITTPRNPVAGQTVRVSVRPDPDVLADGGHKHRQAVRPHGWLRSLAEGWGAQGSTFSTGADFPAYGNKVNPGTLDYTTAADARPFTTDNSGRVTLWYVAPEISGGEIISVYPPNQAQAVETKVLVHVTGLQNLTAITRPYIQASTPTTAHPYNHYGTPALVTALTALAKNVHDASLTSGSSLPTSLPVYDMALPFGGLFDTTVEWQVPHLGHQLGTEADLGLKPAAPAVATPFEKILRQQGWWLDSPALWRSHDNIYHVALLGRGKVSVASPVLATAAWTDASRTRLKVSVVLQNQGGLDATGLYVTGVVVRGSANATNVLASPPTAPLPISCGATAIRATRTITLYFDVSNRTVLLSATAGAVSLTTVSKDINGVRWTETVPVTVAPY